MFLFCRRETKHLPNMSHLPSEFVALTFRICRTYLPNLSPTIILYNCISESYEAVIISDTN